MRRSTKIAAIAFGGVPLAILAISSAVAVAISMGAPAWLRLLFRPLCHGIADRCFLIAGVAMPICARCTGVYIGMVLGIASFLFFRPLQLRRFPTAALALLLLPMAIDGITQALGLRVSTNELRVLTGVIAGWGGLVWVLSRLERDLPRVKSPVSDARVEAK